MEKTMNLIELMLKISAVTVLMVLTFVLYEETTFKNGLEETKKELVSIANQSTAYLTENDISERDAFGVFSYNPDVFHTTLKPFKFGDKENYMMRYTKLGSLIHVMPDNQRNWILDNGQAKYVEIIYDNQMLGKLPASENKVIAECIAIVNYMMPISESIQFQRTDGFYDGKNMDGSDATMKDIVRACDEDHTYFQMKIK